MLIFWPPTRSQVTFLHFVCRIQSLVWQLDIRLTASAWRSSASSFCMSDSSDWRAPSCSTHTVIDSSKAFFQPRGVCVCHVLPFVPSHSPCSERRCKQEATTAVGRGRHVSFCFLEHLAGRTRQMDEEERPRTVSDRLSLLSRPVLARLLSQATGWRMHAAWVRAEIVGIVENVISLATSADAGAFVTTFVADNQSNFSP